MSRESSQPLNRHSPHAPHPLTLALFLLLLPVLLPVALRADDTGGRAGEPMSTSPAELLAWAAETTVGAPDAPPVTLLWRDDRYRFDAAGRLTYSRHWIYTIRHPEALDAWSTSEARWSPWHQKPPSLRARIISPDGQVHRVDNTGKDPRAPNTADPLDDRRLVLRMPLPDVVVGSVIEEELVLSDREPLFGAGVTYRHPLVLPLPVAAGRLVLEAPTQLPLRFGVRLAPELAPERSVVGDTVRLDFRYGPMAAAAPVEPWQPAEAPRFPHIAFATGADWESVGAGYHALIEAALVETATAKVGDAQSSSAPALPVSTEGEDDAIEDRVDALLAELRRRVEPVRRPLETAALGPSPPGEVLARGRGDSEDLATLLVSWLRERGIPAHVALVAGGHGQDVEHSLPGLGLFDRALVYVPAGGALWIDPTDPWSRAGELPAECLDRWILVASPTVRQLIRTPEASPEDNRNELEIDVYLANKGPSRIVEQGVYHGEVERAQRGLAVALTGSDRLRAYLDYAGSAYLARELGEWKESDPKDLSQPYQLEIEAKTAERGFTEGDAAAFAVLRRDLLIGLPRELLIDPASDRRSPFVLRVPFTSRRRIRIHPPPGFRPGELPEDASFAVGTGRFEQSFRIRRGVIEATLRFTTGETTELTPDQLAVYRHAARLLMLEDPLVVELWRADEGQLGRDPGD